MQQPKQPERVPTAFISCSLRPEDAPFINYIEKLARAHSFRLVGTVGRHEAAPKPIWQQMKENIKSADCMILVATPRYIQQDVADKARTGKAISEMLHVEVGMAMAYDRPILTFVLEGTTVGNFLPQAVQYITLNPVDPKDVYEKWGQIGKYFASARTMIKKRWEEEDRASLIKVGVGLLAAIGGVTLLKSMFGDQETDGSSYDPDDGYGDDGHDDGE